jgi:hypothetical protein
MRWVHGSADCCISRELLSTPSGPTVGGTRTTVGLPNSRRLRPGQLDALKQSLLGVLRKELLPPALQGSSCGITAW